MVPGVSPQMTQQQAESQTILNTQNLSPHLIELYIDINEDVDMKRIWHLLRVETSLPYRCGECIAETFDIESDTQKSNMVALRITWGSGDHYQYLIFKKPSSSSNTQQWKFVGNIDSQGQPFAPPVHRIENGDNRSWFVLREFWGRQEKSEAYGEVWYEIRDNGVKRVLSYPLSGENHLCRKGLGYSYKSILSRYGTLNGTYTVPIQLFISYNITDCERGTPTTTLFAKEQSAFYVWDDAQERFQLDAAQSDVTEKEVKSLFSIEGLEDASFVQYNFDQLSEIAKGRDTNRRDWLKRFLATMQDGPRKAALLEAMRQ